VTLIVASEVGGNINALILFAKWSIRNEKKVRPGINLDMLKNQFKIVTWGQERRR
jgi:hypothetical protein